MSQKEAAKRWYEKNKTIISEKRKGNRKEEHRLYYQKNKEYFKLKTKEWQIKNPEKVKEIQRKSRSSNNARRLFNLVKTRAKNKGLDFNLTIDYINSIIPNICPYLQTTFIYGDKNKSMSVDRIDNTKGYVIGNVEIISTQANRMKNMASLTELKIFAQSILARYKDL